MPGYQFFIGHRDCGQGTWQVDILSADDICCLSPSPSVWGAELQGPVGTHRGTAKADSWMGLVPHGVVAWALEADLAQARATELVWHRVSVPVHPMRCL